MREYWNRLDCSRIFGSAEHGFLQGRSSHRPAASYAISLRAAAWIRNAMMFAAHLRVDDIAILEETIDRALTPAAERGIDVAPGNSRHNCAKHFETASAIRRVS